MGRGKRIELHYMVNGLHRPMTMLEQVAEHMTMICRHFGDDICFKGCTFWEGEPDGCQDKCGNGCHADCSCRRTFERGYRSAMEVALGEPIW